MTDRDIKHLFENMLDWMEIVREESNNYLKLRAGLLEKEQYIRSYLEKITEGD